MTKEIEKFYSVRDVMAITKRSRQTIYAYINGGLLKARKLKQGAPNSKLIIAESDLNEFLERGVPAGYYQDLYPRPHKKDKKKED